ncbi:MAG: hypothetical protein ABEJ82_02380 [Haloplanus sp.]
MPQATCRECGHEWECKPPEELEDGPRCSDCGSREVEVEDDFSDIIGPATSRRDRLEEALEALPGVGERKKSYALKMWDGFEAVRTPSELRGLVADLDGVDDRAASMVVGEVFEDAEEPADGDGSPAPQPPAQPPPQQGGGTDALEAIVALSEAGLIGGGADGDSGTDPEEVAAAVGETVNEAMTQIARTQQQLAQAIQQDGGESEQVAELKEEVEKLREENREKELEHLREKVEELESGSDPDPEVAKLRHTAEVQRDAMDKLNQTANRLIDAGDENLLMWLDRRFGVGEELAEQAFTPPGSRIDYDPSQQGPTARQERSRQAAATDGGEPDADDRPEQPDDRTQADEEYAQSVADKLLDGDNTEG